MHSNPAFRKPGPAANLRFAGETGFGTLTLAGDGGLPLASHIPFLVEDGRIEAHLTRANPILRALRDGPRPALLAVVGPDGYISPDWYGEADQVPTWNYVAVHIRGALAAASPERLHDHLDRLSARFEADLAPKAPWTTGKMAPDALARMMRMIVPVTLAVETVEGTWKLGQNKSDAARLGAADALGDTPLSRLMRSPPES